MTVTALYPVLMTDRPAASARFYADLLDLEAVFEADWFVQLTGQMGFVARDHDSVPERFRGATPTGLLVTVEVDDVDAVHERAVALGLPLELTAAQRGLGPAPLHHPRPGRRGRGRRPGHPGHVGGDRRALRQSMSQRPGALRISALRGWS